MEPADRVPGHHEGDDEPAGSGLARGAAGHPARADADASPPLTSARAPRVKHVTLDQVVGVLGRDLRDEERVGDSLMPTRLVMHSGPAEPDHAPRERSVVGRSSARAPDLPRPPRVPTIPGARMLAPTVASVPPGGTRERSVRRTVWLALALVGALVVLGALAWTALTRVSLPLDIEVPAAAPRGR